jgi:aerobic-type carbon monoxide dehydrogenase small subunit (CoxS/CutS family)
MSAQGLLNQFENPSETEINDGMAGVLCRCTGHIKVKDAIRNVAKFRRAG